MMKKMWSKLYRKIFFVVFIGIAINTSAQITFEDFCNNITEEDKQIKQSENLIPFFNKLIQLSNNEIKQVNILHVGDSHIQADWMSGKVRVELQKSYGNAGRGLIFPYHVAGSNSPADVYSRSNYSWNAYRNVHKQDEYEIGISGFVIASQESNAYLKLALNDKNDMGGYGFNKVTVFHPKKADLSQLKFYTAKDRDVIENNVVSAKNVYYTVKSGDNLGSIAVRNNSSVSFIQKSNGLKSTTIYPGQKLIVGKVRASSSFLSENMFESIPVLKFEKNEHSTSYYLPEMREFVFLRNTSQAQQLTQWDGFVLEDTTNTGVLYHTIGVNGAEFRDYNEHQMFFKQLPDLKADLIIVSLGTNESFDTDMSEEDFIEAMTSFFYSLKENCPNATFLISTPTDNAKASTKVARFAEIIEIFALANNIAYFDYYKAVGGKGAFASLRKTDLAQRDGVHLKAKGYLYLGQLMSEAIMNAAYNYSLNGND